MNPEADLREADLESARQYELKGHRLCGNCWVEGWPARAQPRSLDGLRLRLDLRLEPLEATKTELDPRAEQASETVTEPGIGPARGFTQRIASRALSVPRSVQALSVAAGLGVVLVSLALWNHAPPQETIHSPVPAAASSRLTAASREAVAVVPSAVDAGTSGTKASAQLEKSGSAGSAAPAAAPVVQNCPEPSVERRSASAPGTPTRSRARARTNLEGTSQHPILTSTRREASGAASSAEADLMYLFSDIR